MKTYEATCMYDGWRIDSHTVRAGSDKTAKLRVRNRYVKSARRRITGITVRVHQPIANGVQS